MGRKPAGANNTIDVEAIEGADEAFTKVETWLKDFKGSADFTQGMEIKLLRKAKGGDVEIEAYDFDVDEEPKDVADLIIEDALKEAGEYTGTIQFRLQTIFNKSHQKTGFKLKVISEVDEDGDLSDDPNEMPHSRGLVAQQMRHHEVLTRELISAARETRSERLDIIDRLNEDNNRLRQENNQFRAMLNEVQDLKLKREIMWDEHRRTEERKDDMVKMGKLALPLIANRLLGGGPEGAKAAQEFAGQTVQSASLFALFNSLNEEQQKDMQAFVEKLNPLQQAMLSDIIQSSAPGASQSQSPEVTQASRAPSNGSPYPNGASSASVSGNAPFPRT